MKIKLKTKMILFMDSSWYVLDSLLRLKFICCRISLFISLLGCLSTSHDVCSSIMNFIPLCPSYYKEYGYLRHSIKEKSHYVVEVFYDVLIFLIIVYTLAGRRTDSCRGQRFTKWQSYYGHPSEFQLIITFKILKMLFSYPHYLNAGFKC